MWVIWWFDDRGEENVCQAEMINVIIEFVFVSGRLGLGGCSCWLHRSPPCKWHTGDSFLPTQPIKYILLTLSCYGGNSELWFWWKLWFWWIFECPRWHVVKSQLYMHNMHCIAYIYLTSLKTSGCGGNFGDKLWNAPHSRTETASWHLHLHRWKQEYCWGLKQLYD